MGIFQIFNKLTEYESVFSPYIVSHENFFIDEQDKVVTKFLLSSDAPKEALEARDKHYELVCSPKFYPIR